MYRFESSSTKKKKKDNFDLYAFTNLPDTLTNLSNSPDTLAKVVLHEQLSDFSMTNPNQIEANET